MDKYHRKGKKLKKKINNSW